MFELTMSSLSHRQIVILEDASIELVPKKFQARDSCKLVESRFGIPPENQILDDNFHHDIVERLPEKEKRGRPDVVHFALLDIMGTPAYRENMILPIIHTINQEVIRIGEGVRPPRTEMRFNGVMSKILRNEMGKIEKDLFQYDDPMDTKKLIRTLSAEEVYVLSASGVRKDLTQFVSKVTSSDREVSWIVGGFAKGHFSEKTKQVANEMISISNYELPAHIVTSRLSYEIEKSCLPP